MNDLFKKGIELKTKVIKIKLTLAAIGIGAGLLLLIVAVSFASFYFESATDQVAQAANGIIETAGDFFESMKNFIFHGGKFGTDDVVFKEEFLEHLQKSAILHDIVIDTPMVASALMTENEDMEDMSLEQLTEFYKARIAKVPVDTGNYLDRRKTNESSVKALAYSQVGYYDITCYYDENESLISCDPQVYETIYHTYKNYEVPGIDSDYDKQGITDYDIDKKTCIKYNSITGEAEPYTCEITTRYYFFSYQKFMHYLRNSYLPKFNKEVITDSKGQVSEEMIENAITEIFYRRDDALQWFYEATDSEESMGFLTPNAGYSDTSFPSSSFSGLGSPFGSDGCRSQNNCYKYYGVGGPNSSWYCKRHNGMDLNANTSTSLYAIGSGKVVYVAKGGRNCFPQCNCTGNQVHLQVNITDGTGKEQTITVKYLHLSSVASSVSVGQTINKGDYLGKAGNTGCSDGAHLHLEMLDQENKLINPENFYAAIGCGGSLLGSCNSVRNYCGG